MFELCREHNYRKDLHYHVIAGEGEWRPRDIGHPESVNYNIIYTSSASAHRVFQALADGISPEKIDKEDFKESEEIWGNIVDEVKKEHALEVITFLGMEYYEASFPLALIACTGCVPYGMN